MRLRNCHVALLGVSMASLTDGSVLINEISDKGTNNACQGNDWIELYNSGNAAVDLSEGYILHDDKGVISDNAFTFPPGQIVLPNEYLLLCTKLGSESTNGEIGGDVTDPSSPSFGISSDDTITLVRRQANLADETATQSRVAFEIVSSVTLPNTDDGFDVTYAYNATSGQYTYTSTPTPGKANMFTRIKTEDELLAQKRASLAAQNELGVRFFGMDDRGYKVVGAMPDVLELRVTMFQLDFDDLMANKSFESYSHLQNGTLTTTEGELLARIDSPAKIRPKGQSTLYMGICLGTNTIPYQLDLSALNASQSLFGVEKFYLRHHMGDFSYSRDWAYNRMLARFGLPYLRVRKVVFYINDVKQGFYSLIEAVDQEYVFARNFPKYNPESFALYKVKSMALGCGAYSKEEMKKAGARLSDQSTPPYSFQRGEHRSPVKVEGSLALGRCLDNFVASVFDVDFADVVLAYQRYDENCADMLLGEGLIERDLGTKDWDTAMKDFITDNFRGDEKCTEQCANSDFVEKADVENLLKTFAFYAVLVIADSPMINGNNYYLVQSGDETNGGPGGWKIVAYDFNAARVVFCNNDVCNPRLVHWSITRPTCESLEDNLIVGPLLTDPSLHSRYLEYVREFTETVYANQTFIEEIEQHQAVQENFVKDDFWSVFGAYYGAEMTTESSKWEERGEQFPLLPTMKARAESVREQLAALDADVFPRGPHDIGVNGDYEPWEPCPDWRSKEANASKCAQACKYEGCDMQGWTVESYCNESSGICYHGDYDERCHGLKDEDRYVDMEDTLDGRRTFCRFAAGVPVRASECPAVGAVQSQPFQSAAGGFFGLSSVFGCMIHMFFALIVNAVH
jgi:Lamin Tail Domain/CotH kinase protein